jgi:hypothetical protein
MTLCAVIVLYRYVSLRDVRPCMSMRLFVCPLMTRQDVDLAGPSAAAALVDVRRSSELTVSRSGCQDRQAVLWLS